MQTLEQFSALVHKIYEGATRPDAWPGIIAAIAQSLNAEKGLLLTPFIPGKGGVIFPYGITQDNIALWATHYQPLDLWAQRAVERGCLIEGKVTLGQELVTDEELLESVWYREFLVRMDLFHVINGTVFADGGDFPLVTCPFYRGVNAAPFTEQNREYLRLLLPHVSRALGVMFTLRDAELRVASSLHALNLVHSGILLLDENGKVCFINSAAQQMLAQHDGLQVTGRANVPCALLLDHSDTQEHLNGAIHSALNIELCEAEHFARAVHVRRPSGLADYTVQVSRLPENNPYQMRNSIPRAVVFLKDNARFARLDPGLLKRAYGLTRTEVRAALALGDGGSMESVAGALNIAQSTLKTHLKRIYSKTGVNNRAALISLLMSLTTG